MRTINFLAIVGCLFIFSCNQETIIQPNEISTSVSSSLPSGETLKDAAPFPIGNIWSTGHPTWGNTKGTDLGGPSDNFTASAYGALSTIVQKQLELPLEDILLAEQFNSITPETAIKPHNISISPDSLDFREADAMMAFAEANNMRVHGHILVFDKSVPEWALEFERNDVWTEQQWEDWLENYITTVVTRYKGKMAAWDVANEVLSPLGGGLNPDYFWLKVIGDDYLLKAFQWAEAADPDAKLFINEFGIGFLNEKLRDLIRVADNLKAQGAKVDGIGFQGHIPLPVIMGDFTNSKKNYRRAAEAGYLVHLSELDIAVNVLGLTQEQTDLQHRIQRKKYNDLARAYLDGVPTNKQWGITIWNIADRNSFYNTVKIWFDVRQLFGGDKDFPMLWDENYEVKPAYYGFRNGIKGIEEGWLYPDLYDNSKTASSVILNDVEKREMHQYLESSVGLLQSQFNMSETEANMYVEAAKAQLVKQGLLEK